MSKNEAGKKSSKKIILLAGIALLCAFSLKRDTAPNKA